VAGKRKKTHGKPTEPSASTKSIDEVWRRTIDLFLVLRALGSAASRRRAEKLALALDHEALDVFRIARKLESGLLLVPDLQERAAAHGRSSTISRLRDFTRRHVDLAGLAVLDEQVGRDSAAWYRQGGLLLDAVERVRGYVAAHDYVNVRRPEGERGTVAWSYLVGDGARTTGRSLSASAPSWTSST